MTLPLRREHARFTIDLAVAVSLLVLGLLYGLQALREGLGTLADTGSGFFPFVVAVTLVAASTVVLVQEYRGTTAPDLADEGDDDFQGDVYWGRIAGVLLAALAVPIVGNVVGMIVTLSVALIAIAKIMGLPGWRKPLVLGVAFGAATWLIFVYWLFVPLPAGQLGLI